MQSCSITSLTFSNRKSLANLCYWPIFYFSNTAKLIAFCPNGTELWQQTSCSLQNTEWQNQYGRINWPQSSGTTWTASTRTVSKKSQLNLYQICTKHYGMQWCLNFTKQNGRGLSTKKFTKPFMEMTQQHSLCKSKEQKIVKAM